MRTKTAAGLILLALSGCAHNFYAGPSYVGKLNNYDAPAVAESVASYVKTSVPNSDTVSVKSATNDSSIAPAIEDELRKRGYKIAEPARHQVRYAVQSIDNNVVVMTFLDSKTVATRAFGRAPGTGQLYPVGPYAVGETTQ